MQLQTLHQPPKPCNFVGVRWLLFVCRFVCFRCVYVLPLLNVSGIKQNLIIIVRVQHDMVALLSGGGQPFDVLILVFTIQLTTCFGL